MTTYVVRFDVDTAASPTEAVLDGLEDRIGHTISVRGDRGYSVTVWVDQGDHTDHFDAAAAVELARDGLDLGVLGTSRACVVSVTAQTAADYEQAAFGSDLPVIVGAADVADILGVSRQRVHQLAQTASFPAPIARIKMGPLWDETAILTFAGRWQRKPGRPSKDGAAASMA